MEIEAARKEFESTRRFHVTGGKIVVKDVALAQKIAAMKARRSARPTAGQLSLGLGFAA